MKYLHLSFEEFIKNFEEDFKNWTIQNQKYEKITFIEYLTSEVYIFDNKIIPYIKTTYFNRVDFSCKKELNIQETSILVTIGCLKYFYHYIINETYNVDHMENYIRENLNYTLEEKYFYLFQFFDKGEGKIHNTIIDDDLISEYNKLKKDKESLNHDFFTPSSTNVFPEVILEQNLKDRSLNIYNRYMNFVEEQKKIVSHLNIEKIKILNNKKVLQPQHKNLENLDKKIILLEYLINNPEVFKKDLSIRGKELFLSEIFDCSDRSIRNYSNKGFTDFGKTYFKELLGMKTRDIDAFISKSDKLIDIIK